MSQNGIRKINSFFTSCSPRGSHCRRKMIPTPYAYFPTLMTPDFHDQVSNIKSISHVNARFKRGDEDSCIVLSVGVLASSHPPSLPLQETSAFNLFKILIWFCMRGFGGGGFRVPPPLRFVRGGVLYGCLMGMRGGPKVVLTYSYHFFRLVSPVSNINRVKIWQFLNTYKFKGHRTFNPYIIQFTIPGFHKSAFPFLFCLKVQDFTPYKPNILLGDPLDPHINNTFILHCCVCGGGGCHRARVH